MLEFRVPEILYDKQEVQNLLTKLSNVSTEFEAFPFSLDRRFFSAAPVRSRKLSSSLEYSSSSNFLFFRFTLLSVKIIDKNKKIYTNYTIFANHDLLVVAIHNDQESDRLLAHTGRPPLSFFLL